MFRKKRNGTSVSDLNTKRASVYESFILNRSECPWLLTLELVLQTINCFFFSPSAPIGFKASLPDSRTVSFVSTKINVTSVHKRTKTYCPDKLFANFHGAL